MAKIASYKSFERKKNVNCLKSFKPNEIFLYKKNREKLLVGESITPFVFIPLPFKTDFSFETVYSLPLDCHLN